MRIFAGAMAAALCATGADAATISVEVLGSVGVWDYPQIQRNYSERMEDSILPLMGLGDKVTAGSLGGSASAESLAYGNSSTGEIKVGATALRAGRLGGSSGVADAFAKITETFEINGTGWLVAHMLLDATWAGAGDLVAQMVLNQKDSFNNARDAFGISLDQTPAGKVVDHALEARIYFDRASNETAVVSWDILATVNAGLLPSLSAASAIDAMHTGTIVFSTTDGLTATPSSPTFLSDAAYPDDVAPIPLPAAGWLLALGLAGLGTNRLRRR